MNEEEKKALKVINARTRRLLDELEIEKEDMLDEPKIAYLMQEIRANKTVLNLIEKLQKENEKLKNDYENLSNSVVVKNHYIKNSIPIQKVKDLIEELKENGYWNYLEERDLETTIEILKKLLESRGIKYKRRYDKRY